MVDEYGVVNRHIGMQRLKRSVGIDLAAGPFDNHAIRLVARGEAKFTGVEEYRGHEYRIAFQNEFLIAERDGQPIVTTPDLITLLDSDTGAPITTETLRYGLRVVAIAIPCAPQWRTPEGLALVGPHYFGYKVDYRPFNTSAEFPHGEHQA